MVLWREARWWGLTASIPALVKEMWRGSLSCVSAVTGCWHRALDFTRSLVWSSRENFRDQSTLGFVSVSAGDLYKTGALKGPLVKCEVWTRLDPAVIRKWLFIYSDLYIDRKNFFFFILSGFSVQSNSVRSCGLCQADKITSHMFSFFRVDLIFFKEIPVV